MKSSYHRTAEEIAAAEAYYHSEKYAQVCLYLNLLFDYGNETEYEQNKAALKSLISRYKTLPMGSTEREYIEERINAYADYLVKIHASPEDIRRFNSFALFYFQSKRQKHKDIAQRQQISKRTLFKDLSNMFDALMICFYGIGGIHILPLDRKTVTLE